MERVQRDIQLFVLNKIERASRTGSMEDAKNSLLASIGSINTVLAGFGQDGTYTSPYADAVSTGGSHKTYVVYQGKNRKVHKSQGKKFIKCDGQNLHLSDIRGKYTYV